MSKQEIDWSKAQEWSGEGLPPVGAACEMRDDDDSWCKATVIAHGTDRGIPTAVGQADDKLLWCQARIDCRPIRTPEQIAAARIEEALVAINSTHELVKSLHEACQRNYGAKRQNDAEISSDIKQANINLLAEKVLQIEHENPTRGVYIIDERTAKDLVAMAKELKQ